MPSVRETIAALPQAHPLRQHFATVLAIQGPKTMEHRRDTDVNQYLWAHLRRLFTTESDFFDQNEPTVELVATCLDAMDQYNTGLNKVEQEKLRAQDALSPQAEKAMSLLALLPGAHPAVAQQLATYILQNVDLDSLYDEIVGHNSPAVRAKARYYAAPLRTLLKQKSGLLNEEQRAQIKRCLKAMISLHQQAPARATKHSAAAATAKVAPAKALRAKQRKQGQPARSHTIVFGPKKPGIEHQRTIDLDDPARHTETVAPETEVRTATPQRQKKQKPFGTNGKSTDRQGRKKPSAIRQRARRIKKAQIRREDSIDLGNGTPTTMQKAMMEKRRLRRLKKAQTIKLEPPKATSPSRRTRRPQNNIKTTNRK